MRSACGGQRNCCKRGERKHGDQRENGQKDDAQEPGEKEELGKSDSHHGSRSLGAGASIGDTLSQWMTAFPLD